MAIQIDVDIRCDLEQAGLSPGAGKIEELVAGACRRALEEEGWTAAEVSIVVTSDEEIRALNREYRGIDSPTDVLSFPLLEPEAPGAVIEPGRAGGIAPAGEPVALGDIVISLPRAIEQAREYGHSLERELAFLTVHGTLHLLGYDHVTQELEAAMRAREEAILASLGLRRM